MRKVWALAAVVLILALIIPGCSQAGTSRLKVVTSTTLLASIIERVGGDRVEVINLIPPAQCPGHFDVKPGDIRKLADADLFLFHGWQGEQFTQDVIASAGNTRLTVVKVDIQGNWMVPAVQAEGTDVLTAALCQVDDNNNCPVYQEAAAAYKAVIEAKEADLKAGLAKLNLSRINVLCADQQAGFVKWAGLNVVGIYGRPESLTPQIVKELVDKGRAEKVALLIDNVQSGEDAGKGIAEELGVKRIILSNFPGCFNDTETWEKAAAWNVKLITEAAALLK